MKVKKAIICGSVMALAIFGSSALADPPGKEEWEVRKEQMKYEREWEREERKHYEKLEREERKHLEKMAHEERKHQEKMARKERKYQEKMWRERGYPLEQQGYEYSVDESYEPDYVEDKVYRIIRDLRDATGTLNQ